MGQDSCVSTVTCYDLEYLGLSIRGGPMCLNKCSNYLWAGGTGRVSSIGRVTGYGFDGSSSIRSGPE